MAVTPNLQPNLSLNDSWTLGVPVTENCVLSCWGLVCITAGLMDSKMADVNPSGQDRLKISFRVGGFGKREGQQVAMEKNSRDFSVEMRSGIESRLVAKKGRVHSCWEKLLEETPWAVACDLRQEAVNQRGAVEGAQDSESWFPGTFSFY